MTFEALEAELLALFRAGVEAPLSEEAFNELALRVFRFQCRENPLYRAFVDRRGVDPETVGGWEEIPALPTRAFKAAPLVSGSLESVEAVFRTSGTTRGPAIRGEHHVRSLALYRGSLAPNLRAHLLPEGKALRVLALLPSPREAPDSSLSFMVGEVARWWREGQGGEMAELRSAPEMGGGIGGSTAFFVDPDLGIREEAFRGALLDVEAAGFPVLLAGTAFAFAQWMETARDRGWQARLPEGSRIMETGGYKGRVRALSREDLYRGMEEVFGVPARRTVNEYGMTELLSQFYEPVLVDAAPEGGAGDGREAGRPRGDEGGDSGISGGPSRQGRLRDHGDSGERLRFYRPPPWVRTRALHPLTLEPVAPGEPGILAHLDLANLGSVARVLTEDLGTLTPGGFTLMGRAPGAEPRGCSLAMEDFMTGLEAR